MDPELHAPRTRELPADLEVAFEAPDGDGFASTRKTLPVVSLLRSVLHVPGLRGHSRLQTEMVFLAHVRLFLRTLP